MFFSPFRSEAQINKEAIKRSVQSKSQTVKKSEKAEIPKAEPTNPVKVNPDKAPSQPPTRETSGNIYIIDKEERIFQAVEEPAEFPGGQTALMNWLKDNIHYPEGAQKRGISGRVIVRFVIEKDGSISNCEVAKGVDPELDKEAVNLAKRMPKWNPARNGTEVVRSYFTLPITFKLNK